MMVSCVEWKLGSILNDKVILNSVEPTEPKFCLFRALRANLDLLFTSNGQFEEYRRAHLVNFGSETNFEFFTFFSFIPV